MKSPLGRFNLFFTNIAFFGGLKVLGALFPLFIFPFVTRRLDGADAFGMYDIFLVISSLSASVAMMGIPDAMFRQYYIKCNAEYRKEVTATGFVIVVTAAIIVSLMVAILKNFIQVMVLNDNHYYSIIYFAAFYILLQNLFNVSVHPSRLDNNKKHLLFNTLFYAVIFYAVVLLLLHLSYGLYALIYAHLVAAGIMAIYFIYLNSSNFFPVRFSKDIAWKLLQVGLPLMPIFLIYWANNSIVRILIMKYLGATELGVFAIGSKYASVSTFLQMAFAGGWSFFTFSTMNDKDHVSIKSRIFEALLFIIVVGYAIIVPLAPYFFGLVFLGDYARGYVVFGQLFLAPLFLILYQIIASQFVIIGKSHYSLISLSVGFSVSLLLSFVFLKMGSGIAGLSYSIPISYLTAILIAYFFTRKFKIFDLNFESFVSFGFIIVMNIVLQIEHGLRVYIFLSPLLLIYCYINKRLILELIHMIKRLGLRRFRTNE
ncbi:MAG: hypothetical protein EG826_02340 [Deltaproteobacteria bacterium]|nr:hypothetical protein [Deltaproteobacteria bacterium]